MRISEVKPISGYRCNVARSMSRNLTPSFGEATGHDFFVQDVGIKMLKDEPETFLKNIKPTMQESDVSKYFKEAVFQKMRESETPDLTDKIDLAIRKHYQASRLYDVSSDVIDYLTGKKLAELSAEAKNNAVKEYERLTKANKNPAHLKAYTKIANKLLKTKGFDPNFKEDGESLVESVIKYGDDELAKAIIGHKKFVKPEKFKYSENAEKFVELEGETKAWWGSLFKL